MTIEAELKFLVKGDGWKGHIDKKKHPSGLAIDQAYVADARKSVRFGRLPNGQITLSFGMRDDGDFTPFKGGTFNLSTLDLADDGLKPAEFFQRYDLFDEEGRIRRVKVEVTNGGGKVTTDDKDAAKIRFRISKDIATGKEMGFLTIKGRQLISGIGKPELELKVDPKDIRALIDDKTIEKSLIQGRRIQKTRWVLSYGHKNEEWVVDEFQGLKGTFEGQDLSKLKLAEVEFKFSDTPSWTGDPFPHTNHDIARHVAGSNRSPG